MATGEHQRSLNARSAKAAEWFIRIINPMITSFEYSKSGDKKKMHQFICRVVGEDAGTYCLGVLTSPREADVQKAKDKFLAGTMWKMSKVGLDTKSKKNGYTEGCHYDG